MKLARLRIQNFRGIKEANLFFPDQVVLVGDNNVGKSTVFEAIDLALGPDRLGRRPKIDEHDFHLGDYLTPTDQPRKEVRVEVVVTALSEEQQNHFGDEIEWWNVSTKAFQDAPVEGIDSPDVLSSIRVTFVGYYDPEDDDFAGDTYFARSLEDGGTPAPFTKKQKQSCGFLYLRSLRTASRALSLEHGSLLDIILRVKEIRPQMWEKTIGELNKFTVAADPAIGISGILKSIDTALKKYVPREWGVSPHLKVSNLTRENLRKVIAAFIATGEGAHAAPFYRQGTGTLNMLVLAMLSQIAEDKQNVIFAMEEPETALPPYAQKRIVHEIRKLSSQAIFSSHSPYILRNLGLNTSVSSCAGTMACSSKRVSNSPRASSPNGIARNSEPAFAKHCSRDGFWSQRAQPRRRQFRRRHVASRSSIQPPIPHLKRLESLRWTLAATARLPTLVSFIPA